MFNHKIRLIVVMGACCSTEERRMIAEEIERLKKSGPLQIRFVKEMSEVLFDASALIMFPTGQWRKPLTTSGKS